MWKNWKCDVTWFLPPPLSQTVTLSQTPSPSGAWHTLWTAPLEPAQARAQPMGVDWWGPPSNFYWPPFLWQDFPFHHIPDETIWNSKFQKIPREGLTEPLPWPLPAFSRALPSIWAPPSNLRRFAPLIHASLEFHPQTFEAWLRPCALGSICHVC